MKLILISLFFLGTGLMTSAQLAPVFSTKKGAIDGYDPVAYFDAQKPVRGNESISYEWNGAIWHFSSTENKKLFTEAPETYAPAYGGYCAYAVANGSTAKIDPNAWTILENRLYLNYSKSIQTTWESDKYNYIKKANENWPKLKSGK